MNTQRGAALLVTMVLMGLLVILGLGAFKLVSLQSKIEANGEDNRLGLLSAEAATRQAESKINNDTFRGDGYHTLVSRQSAGITDSWTADGAWADNSTQVVTLSDISSLDKRLVANPRYMIEQLQEPSVFQEENSIVEGHGARERMELYRITSEGTGPSQTDAHFLQSHYTRIVTQ